jgi:hypothetical protein
MSRTMSHTVHDYTLWKLSQHGEYPNIIHHHHRHAAPFLVGQIGQALLHLGAAKVAEFICECVEEVWDEVAGGAGKQKTG